MRVKVDEDLPKAAVEMLRDGGYEAVSVVEQGMSGLKDSPLWEAVQAERREIEKTDPVGWVGSNPIHSRLNSWFLA